MTPCTLCCSTHTLSQAGMLSCCRQQYMQAGEVVGAGVAAVLVAGARAVAKLHNRHHLLLAGAAVGQGAGVEAGVVAEWSAGAGVVMKYRWPGS